jgi:hypothetical protein
MYYYYYYKSLVTTFVQTGKLNHNLQSLSFFKTGSRVTTYVRAVLQWSFILTPLMLKCGFRQYYFRGPLSE